MQMDTLKQADEAFATHRYAIFENDDEEMSKEQYDSELEEHTSLVDRLRESLEDL